MNMQSGLARILLAGAMAAGAGVVRAADYHVPQARVPLLKTPPKIDGEVKEDEWAAAIRMERFCGSGGQPLAAGEASFWVGCDGQKLFIAVVSETPPGGNLLQRVAPAPQDGDARTWLDDSIEIVLDPLRAAGPDRRRLYHANLNARGAIYDQRHTLTGGGEAWRGHWETASKIIGDRWHIEVALPLADVGVTPEDLKQPFGVRVCRNWMRSASSNQSEWGSLGGAFLSPDTMPLVTWDAAAPVVQTLQLRDPDAATPKIRLSVRNPGTEPQSVQALIQLTPKNSAHAEKKEVLTLAAGESKTVELATNVSPNELMYTLLQVTSPDGGTVYYTRDFSWKTERPVPLFILDEGDSARFGLDFAFYPSLDTLTVRADISGLESKDKVTGVRLAVRRKGEKTNLAETAMPALREFKSLFDWKIPKLGEGEYELVATLTGVAGDPVVRPFVRHVFAWEGNKIGTTDTVFPPFTPIAVKGNKVATILRTHTVSKLGLWDQVESLGTPLLKGPMRLEAQVNGRTMQAQGRKLAFSEKKPTRAAAASRWSAGPLAGTVRITWDYDGLMQWDLDLQPAKEKIEALTLTIPLDNALCPLMHVCTDGIRFNYAGNVPAGEGRVWDGAKASRNAIVGSYVPYLWVGEEERGLCVFGENDKGWVTDPNVPCQELVRRGDTLELVLHLVAKPVTIDQARHLRIAFQATPVKPMPEDWRLWIFGSYRAAAIPGITRYLAFLGSCWYWGTDTPCLDYYPRGGDLTFLRKMAEARKTGKMDEAYMEEWLKGFARHYAAAKTPEARKEIETTFRNHTYAGFRTAAGKPQYINIYTNGRGVRFDTPEGQTFLDEWYREAFSKRDWGFCGGVAYDLDPVASFRDYALYYFKEMTDIVFDSIYWDDLFLQSNFDTVGTDAYALPDGTIQPSMGLFNMREYVRRTAVMFLEMKRPIQNIVHMTNTAIVPVLSFAQMNYTWEDKAGDADFQDRFSRDYIRAESLGLQQGNVPFTLWLVAGKDKEKVAWAERTGAGVLLVHELKPSAVPEVFWNAYAKLVAFGYGRPGVTVSQYWKKNHPVTITGSDAVSLVASKPGSAMVAVCDYGNGGDITLALDAQALALPGQIAARDAETGTALEVTADGKVKFALKKHDFKLISLTAGQP